VALEKPLLNALSVPSAKLKCFLFLKLSEEFKMPTFGNIALGDEFIHYMNGDIWGSIFPAPENGYARSITMEVKAGSVPVRVRASLYLEFIENMRKRLRFVMATEEKIVPANFQGAVTLNFTALPPLLKGVKYWINGWAHESGMIQISTKKTPGIYQSAEWTSYMAGQPHGLGYPRFYEIVPQSIRKACVCSIYCTYVYGLPLDYPCPYCNVPFPTYADLLNHIMSTPTEMIHLQICPKCSKTHFLKEELQLHMFLAHGIGELPQDYSCIFCCSFTRPTKDEVYKHINDVHPT